MSVTKELELEVFGSEMPLINCFLNTQLCGPSEQLDTNTELAAFRAWVQPEGFAVAPALSQVAFGPSPP